MTSCRVHFIAVLATVVFASTAHALPASLVERAERATALVEIQTSDGPASGSAFCLDAAGHYATDGHVVNESTGKIQLVLRAGEADQQVVGAHVLGYDYEADLAIIQANTPTNAPTLELGSSDNLSPTQEVTAFGYPFGDMLALDKKSYPTISVNAGKITSLRKKDNELSLIQIDALVNPGNSGGPVLDANGKVIGLVEAGIPGAGLNFATPIAKLQRMMKGPLLILSPSSIDYNQRNKPQVFTVRLSSLSKAAIPDYSVALELTDPSDKTQTVTGKLANDTCDLQATPMADAKALKWNMMSGEAPPTFKFKITLKDGDRVVSTSTGTMPIGDLPMGGIGIGPGGRVGKGKNGGAQKRKKADSELDDLPANAAETEIAGLPGAPNFRQIDASANEPIGVRFLPMSEQGQTGFSEINLVQTAPATKMPHVIVAREGYVVGGLLVDGDQFIDAFKVTFIRKNSDGTLNPRDTYTGAWHGTPENGKQQHLGEKGDQVIGIFGRKTDRVINVGLVISKPSATTAPSSRPTK